MEKVRRFTAVLLSFVLLTLVFSGCGAKKQYTVGIIVFAEHASLDSCKEGLLEGLSDAGLKMGDNLLVSVMNSKGSIETAQAQAIHFKTENYDLVCTIATPSSVAAYEVLKDSGIPLIYTAVSYPYEAGLSNENGMPIGEVTGTSDALAIPEQLEMIERMLPEAKKIGILYSVNEVNSVTAVKEYERISKAFGFEIVAEPVDSLDRVEKLTEELCKKVDCICNITDNTIVSKNKSIIKIANSHSVPVFGSEVEQVREGCIAAMGLDYYSLGVQTGHMAAKVLLGEKKASEMPYETFYNPSLYINNVALNKNKILIDESLYDEASRIFIAE